MSLKTETINHDNKLSLLFRQGVRSRRACGCAPEMPREERMQRWQHRLEKLFARQVY
ncbi:hypothetical protein J9253_06555 [Thiothrix litoralis]|jgi:hypothetical protein|uniref:Uncharacterized protein n=1 Tax=Thiothrix litoralis TaxID=2891210 RepID=A0ABX7WUW1_9GAMM|nr:hypothetical protein [Thiothrix litoralis]QTR47589.1 hypothetical protein J9253_06555 [Thiothrix litoralis]